MNAESNKKQWLFIVTSARSGSELQEEVCCMCHPLLWDKSKVGCTACHKLNRNR